eukprot:sb/3471989/
MSLNCPYYHNRIVKKYQGLTRLTVECAVNGTLNCSNLNIISNLKQLKDLTLDGNKVDESGYNWLPQCASLQSVSLSHSTISDREVTEAILTLKNLKSLSLSNCSNIEGTFLYECQARYTESSVRLTIRCPDHLQLDPAEFPKFILLNCRSQEVSDDDDDPDWRMEDELMDVDDD